MCVLWVQCSVGLPKRGCLQVAALMESCVSTERAYSISQRVVEVALREDAAARQQSEAARAEVRLQPLAGRTRPLRIATVACAAASGCSQHEARGVQEILACVGEQLSVKSEASDLRAAQEEVLDEVGRQLAALQSDLERAVDACAHQCESRVAAAADEVARLQRGVAQQRDALEKAATMDQVRCALPPRPVQRRVVRVLQLRHRCARPASVIAHARRRALRLQLQELQHAVSEKADHASTLAAVSQLQGALGQKAGRTELEQALSRKLDIRTFLASHATGVTGGLHDAGVSRPLSSTGAALAAQQQSLLPHQTTFHSTRHEREPSFSLSGSVQPQPSPPTPGIMMRPPAPSTSGSGAGDAASVGVAAFAKRVSSAPSAGGRMALLTPQGTPPAYAV